MAPQVARAIAARPCPGKETPSAFPAGRLSFPFAGGSSATSKTSSFRAVREQTCSATKLLHENSVSVISFSFLLLIAGETG